MVDSARAPWIEIEIVYATTYEQVVLSRQLRAGTRVLEALQQCGILEKFPEGAALALPVGVFGKRVSLDTELLPGDRVEIYRPLLIDPKELRRKKAELMKPAQRASSKKR